MKKIHMIGNAHLDPVWLWDYREGFAEIKATFSSVLERMEEDEDFIFTGSSAAYYEWVEQNCPGMFEAIKKRVEEGRWKLAGGAWIQPDCNLPGGESFVRQFLMGQGYFMEKFGIRCRVAYNVDSFGHNIILPQIIKKSGMDHYVFMRPMPDEKTLPGHIFNFTAKDGSSVTAFRILYEYLSGPGDIESHINRCFQQIGSNDSIMCFYGVGNHGGGPTKENLAAIHRLQSPACGMELLFSDPQRFFEEAPKTGLPCVADELQHHAVGCYSSFSGIKNANKKAEARLYKAEVMASLSNLLGDMEAYPKNELNRAWKNVLFNQFHDILPGTSIRSAYGDVFDLYGETSTIAGRILNNAVQRLTWAINIENIKDTTPFVVINLTQWRQEQPMEVEVPLKSGDWELYDYEGNKIMCQFIPSEASVDRRVHPRGRLCFTQSLPSFGYKAFYLKEAAVPGTVNKAPEEFVIENEYLKVEIDRNTGRLSSVYDKLNKLYAVEGMGIGPLIFRDLNDTWAHGVTYLEGESLEPALAGIEMTAFGNVKKTVRVVYRCLSSTLIFEYSLYHHIKYIHVKVRSYLSDQQLTAKLEIPLRVNFSKISADMSFSFIERDCSGKESFYHRFVDMEGLHKDSHDVFGLSVMTDGRYSYSAVAGKLSVTLFRNTVYANHEPYVCENSYLNCTDEGYNEFELVIHPHAHTWKRSDTLAYACQLNVKPVIQMETYHKGEKKVSDSFITIDKDNITLSALKQCEKSADYVLRLAEYLGEDTTACVDFLGMELLLHFTAFEVKTLVIYPEEKTYCEADMLEEIYEK